VAKSKPKPKPKPKRIANTNAKTELQASKLDAKAQQVIELYFTGITQREIGVKIGLSVMQVFKILQDTKNLWHEWRLDEWDTRITGELARIDRVESEALAAWGRS